MNNIILTIIVLIILLIYYYLNKNINLEKVEDTINENDFYNREYPKCLKEQPEDNSICKVENTRQCKVEGTTCFRNEKDENDAIEYAYRKLCLKKGHCFTKYDDGSYECLFTKETCLKASEKPMSVRPEISLGENGTPMSYSYMEWRDGIGCVDGTGYGLVKKFCEKDHPCGMGLLKYDSSNGTCKITPAYCEELRMKYENGKCYPKDVIAESIFGKSVVRGIATCPKYADFWTDPSKTNSKDLAEHYDKATSNVCIMGSLN